MRSSWFAGWLRHGCLSLLAALVLAGYAVGAQAQAAATTSASAAVRWVGSWSTAPYAGDPWHTVPTLIDSTLREVVHTSLSGTSLRVRLTNEYGTEPLRIDAASVALSAGADAIQPQTMHPLTFGGQASVVIPYGAMVLSDPVDLATPAFADLTVSLYLPVQTITNITFHGGAQQTNFIQRGNEVTAPSLSAPEKNSSWYFLKGIDVTPVEPRAAAVVTFGDSITDGAYATDNMNHRWSDYLAVRLHNNAATANLSVLNEGIGGNCVLITCIAPNALARFDRDVLGQAGVRYVIVLESINDIGQLHEPNHPDYTLTAQDLEMGLSQIVARAHEHGIKVFGATLTPYKGAGYFTEQGEQIREAVNTWILTSHVFDAAIDFDKATRDPANPLVYSSAADSGDHLHPKDAGYSSMADSIDLSLFR
ncbi:MAG TPA: SGNH/GDSL hydrolase family protein [Acidobacteriaceae bacterium]|jgi:lysophospholipase L1-like esterase|nr:SGNH/GDSL hydrolase family protein [Acidobacteriaceae bacterium]